MRVLLIRLGALGDLVHTLPLAADLTAAGCTVDWLVEDRFADVLRGSPAIRHLVEVPRRAWRRAKTGALQRLRAIRRIAAQLRRERYDVAIDAQGLLKGAMWLPLAGARWRVGFRRGRARELTWLLPAARVPADAVHVVDQQRALALPLLAALSRQAWPPRRLIDRARQPGPPRCPLPPWTAERAAAAAWLASVGRPRPWVMNVGAGWPTKVWPEARQAAFCRLAVAAGRPPVLAWGGPSERAMAERVAAAAPGAILAPDTTIPQLAGLLAQAAVVVSGDTGPLHLAWGLGVPCVGLFGPVPHERNGPRGPRCTSIQAPPGAMWERKDVKKVHMDQIDEAAVLAAAQRVASD